jgi:MFS family permease
MTNDGASKTPWNGRDQYLLVAAFFNCAVSAGLFQTFSVLYVALLREEHWSRAETAGIYSIAMLTTGAAVILGGMLLPKLGPRLLMVGASTLAGVGLALTSQVTGLFALHLTYGVIAAGGLGVMSWVVQGAILAPYFTARLGLANGIAFAGMGIGVLILAGLTQGLIETLGWRMALLVLGVSVGIIGIIINGLTMPSDLELFAVRINKGEGHHRPSRRKVLVSALHGIPFWALFCILTFTSAASYGVANHQAACIVDVGFSPRIGASVVAITGFLSAVGRIFFGFLSDRLGRLTAGTFSFAASIVGLITLIAMSGSGANSWILAAYVAFFGISFGARAPILSAIAAEQFGGPYHGTIWGLMCVGNSLGGALGAWGGGLMFDVSGSYVLAFVAAILALLISNAALFLAVRRQPRLPFT